MREEKQIQKRRAGILLPVSSLPSPYGIGNFGKEAYQWIDMLAQAGQSDWQLLPMGPTSYGDSPYQSFSAFAGNPYFIDFEMLTEQGLLEKADYQQQSWGAKAAQVDYALLFEQREPVLRRAFARFQKKERLELFRLEHSDWIEDYALYMSIKSTQGHRSWLNWEPALRNRERETMTACMKHMEEDINYHCFVQYLFFEQWNRLHRYAREKGVRIIGDIPIYVALDSADVWAGREMFQLDADGVPTEVSGCPPDAFSEDGQLWGNPLYDWKGMQEDGFSWWISRVRACFALYDVLRIDHFRGLESYYAIPYGDETARNGRWRKGPGMALIDAIKRELPQAEIIAEDLGFLTDEVRELLAESGYPGMKVLQFAFDSREQSDYSPYTYGPNSVVYTGTHDNETLRSWLKSASPDSLAHARAYFHVKRNSELPEAMIRLALASPCRLALVPLQDYLGLGAQARMNIPSTVGGNNWRWRLKKGQIRHKDIERLRALTELYGRTQAKQT